MNHNLAEAVIATFRAEDTRVHYRRLSKFSSREWEGTYSWLDASGLALYFLDRLKALHLEAGIPPSVLHRLKTNAADNREKTNSQFKDFIKINLEFKKAGLSYANLKGFTLAPDAFAEPALRLQLDLDFLIYYDDVSRCQQILEQQKYSLAGTGNGVREFKAESGQMPAFKDLYKVKLQRCIEIHFDSPHNPDGSDFQTDRLSRLSSRRWQSLDLPILSDCDRFIAQAVHLFKHLKSEWTRASWILEFANLINFHEQNETLWAEVRQRVLENEEIRLAIGAATLISHQNFDIPRLPEVLAWTIRQLPQQVCLWFELYGEKIVLTKFPGTKLYLLLCTAVSQDKTVDSSEAHRKLLPMRRPARITVEDGNARLLAKLRREKDEIEYFFFDSASILNMVATT